jgi:hypothetical protein
VGFLRRDRDRDSTDPAPAELGWTPSDWAVLVRQGDEPLVLPRDGRWSQFPAGRGAPWTDDFSDLVRAFRW